MTPKGREAAERAIADWLLATLRLYSVDEANAHRIVTMFMEALDAHSAPQAGGEEG